MPVTSRDRRKPKNHNKPTKGPACPSCGAATLSEARFCHACGAALGGGPCGRKWSAGLLTGLGAGAVFVAVVVFGLVMYSERDSDAPSSLAPAATSRGGLPDLSQMTPRQAADGLFNRIMMANEQGDRAEALRFVPMAIEAYDGLPVLDRDAHYHLGLIHGVAGDRANVDRQIAALRHGAPDHLLALVLEHRSAERAGDNAAAARVLAAFAAAYDAEIATRRPEYEAHRNTIEDLRAAATSAAAASSTEPAGAEPTGAALFARNCAACHGPDAAGTEKGPPLVDKIYEPSHHDDASFYRAVRHGARAHHWSFGDMPPVTGVSDGEVGRITAYVRELQRAAGIR